MANSPLDAANFLTGIKMRLEENSKKALTKVGRVVSEESKRVLGTYDYGWPRLQPETIKHKATGDSPLLETGELRESIGYTVDEENHTVAIGTNDPNGKFMELGTSRIPPRSFLVAAAMAKEAEIQEILGRDRIEQAVKESKEAKGLPTGAVSAFVKDIEK